MSNQHVLEDYFSEEDHQRIRGAAGMALVTGSRGSTDVREYRKLDGTLVQASDVTVEAVEVDRHFGPAYRVTTHQNMVVVMPGRPGRYTSHATEDTVADLV